MGFMAKKKADEDPQHFGGRGMAIGGMVAGALGFVVGTATLIWAVLFGLLANVLGRLELRLSGICKG